MLLYRKSCAHWVPWALSDDHKTADDRCPGNLTWYMHEEERLLSRIVISDKSWIQFHTPETKRQSKAWIQCGKSAPPKLKTHESAGKVMLTLFWDNQGVMLIEYLPSNWSVNKDTYCETLFKLRAAIKRKSMGTLSAGIDSRAPVF